MSLIEAGTQYELISRLESHIQGDFFVKGWGEEREKVRRKDTILAVFKVHRTLNAFRPAFFFSQKDSGQLDAIKRVYGMDSSLCLWHLKRAIKHNISGLRKEKKCALSDERERELMEMITLQFNRHPFLTSLFRCFSQKIIQ